MKDWIFYWSSKRSPIWESATFNMNVALDHPIEGGIADGMYPHVHVDNIPVKYHDVYDFSIFNGSWLDQFEQEAFKFVVQYNNSAHNPQDHLVIKQHMYPDMSLNESNCKTINLDTLSDMLDKHSWVALGTIMSNAKVDKFEAVAISTFYTRDEDTLDIVRLSGSEDQPEQHKYLPVVTYCVFKRTADSNVITCVMNPNMMSLTHLINEEVGHHRISTIDNTEGSFESSILSPIISNGKLIGDTIFADENGVVLHEFEGSMMYLKYELLPNYPKVIFSNLEYTVDGNKITVIPDDTKLGYISIEYEVDSFMSNYVHINNKKYIVQYKITKE